MYPLPDLATPYAKLAISMAGLNITDAGLKGRSTAELARMLACLALPSEHAARKAAICAAAETDTDAQACYAVHALKSTLRSGASIIEVAAVLRETMPRPEHVFRNVIPVRDSEMPAEATAAGTLPLPVHVAHAGPP